jgi:methylase of polypeptide subunit release factors
MKKKDFYSTIKILIKDLSEPDYITNMYEEIGIKSLIVLRNVFRTDKSYLGNYLAKILVEKGKLFRNKTVLDLGCGGGLMGIICAMKGARKVHFSDINPIAVKNSRLNIMLLDIKGASYSAGDLFENIPNLKFDIIIFNMPAILSASPNYINAAFLRDDILVLNFFKLFPKYLNKGGYVLMPGSTRFNKSKSIKDLVKENGNKFKVIAKEFEENNEYKYIIKINK